MRFTDDSLNPHSLMAQEKVIIMPRGFSEIYSKRTKSVFFSCIAEMLNSGGFFLERPDTGAIQIWNADGDMLEISKSEIPLHVQQSSLIKFWDKDYDCVSVIFEEGCAILFLDGFDAKETEELFRLIASFTLTKCNYRINGFVFDRREISENVDWSKCIQARKLTMDAGNELKIVSQKTITMNSPIGFDVDNVYLAIRKTDSSFELSELKQKI